ncbi:hypothetical protein HMPREF9134_01108 [Porphyromonas catoniae F0037]|uniref:Uncharacterized protein n=1 Tax=Porphyromonas catoniae F0037 TaxID=1127696 RepID=L1NCV4_9PORP|nr:hypothetical protein HMPREF9134_01108 [Porphyromonas catoniae F0037]
MATLTYDRRRQPPIIGDGRGFPDTSMEVIRASMNTYPHSHPLPCGEM